MTLPVATGKANATLTVNDHPDHHNGLATAVNDDLLRAALVPVTPVRALNTNFTPSATRPVWVSYTVELVTPDLVVGATSARVELRSDTAATPTTIRAQASSSQTGSIVAVILSRTNRQQLSYLVPAGHTVRLVSVLAGSGTATLLDQVETVL